MFQNICSLLLKIYSGAQLHLRTIMCSLVILQVVRFLKRGSFSLWSITLIFAVVHFEDIFKSHIYVALTLSPSVQVLSQLFSKYKVVSKIFEIYAVKIVKFTIRPISHRHPQRSSLLHVDTGPTVSSVSGMLPGSPFLSECQARSANRPVLAQWYQTGILSASIPFLEIVRSHRVTNQVSMVGGGWQPFCFSVQFSSVQTLTRCCLWPAVRILGINLAATQCTLNSSIRTCLHVP